MSNPRPRWLEVAAQEAEVTDIEGLNEQIRDAETLLGLTENPAWELYTNMLINTRDDAISAIMDPNRVMDMNVMAAFRARARILDWLIGLPDRLVVERDNLLEQAAEEGETTNG